MRMHKGGKPCLETILGWKVFCRPRLESSYSSVSVDPFTGKRRKEHASTKTVGPSEFTFGYNAPWSVVLSWSAGDDKPPIWFRYEDNLIKSPGLGHMPNQHLCEPVLDIPPGVKLHIWKPRADHRSAGGSHWHAKVKLSEHPYYLELYWRRTDTDLADPKPIGVFRLDLNGLLRNGYIRLDKSGQDGTSSVRLRFYRADDGSIYVQTKQGKPKLLISTGSLSPKEAQQPPIDLPEPPSRYEAKVSRIIRDTKHAGELKSLYGFACQICGCGFRMEPTPNYFYIEVHHVRPLGGVHAGLDIRANMLVLCPNHHAMFDYGIPRFLSPQRIEIADVIFNLTVKHELSPDSVEYHNTKLRNRQI